MAAKIFNITVFCLVSIVISFFSAALLLPFLEAFHITMNYHSSDSMALKFYGVAYLLETIIGIGLTITFLKAVNIKKRVETILASDVFDFKLSVFTGFILGAIISIAGTLLVDSMKQLLL